MQGAPRVPSAGALGPAAGRISVYEQRAKILFELGRAQVSQQGLALAADVCSCMMQTT